jgi:hypothetical protein
MRFDRGWQPNSAVKLSVRDVTGLATARPAPTRPAAYGERLTDSGLQRTTVSDDATSEMTLFTRLRYAFFLAVVVVGCAVIADMIIHARMGEIIFSYVFFVPVFSAEYLIAPALGACPSNRTGL